MRPGESRWVEITGDGGALTRDASVEIYEVVRSTPVNGYSFVFHPAPMNDVVHDNLVQHGALMARLAALGVSGAKDQTERTRQMLSMKYLDPAAMMKFVRAGLAVLRSGVKLPNSPTPASDPFAIADGVKALEKIDDGAAFAAAHRSLLNRADALVSMIRKQSGDTADVWQMVRTQRERFSSGRFASPEVVRLSDALLRRPLASAYGTFMQQVLPYLQKTATASGDKELLSRYKTLAAARSVEAIEGAHRDFLWRLEMLDRSPTAAK